MKPAPLLVAVSLLANAALIAAILAKPDLAPLSVREVIGRISGGGETAVSSAQTPVVLSEAVAPAGVSRGSALWSALYREDMPAFLTRLKGAGFPPAVIAGIARTAVDTRYGARLRAYSEPDQTAPFWRQQSLGVDHGRLAEYNQLQRERAKLLRELLAIAGDDDEGQAFAQRQRFGELPREKLAKVQGIDDDYAAMVAAVRAAANGILTPGDRATLALLDREKQADLATVLSPEEAAEYNLRTSPLVSSLKSSLRSLEVSEAEFRAIFRIQQALNESYPATESSSAVLPYQQQLALQQRLESELKASLGDARYRDYRRGTSDEYQALRAAAAQAGLPENIPGQVYDLRDALGRDAARLAGDASLDVEQKRAAFQTLAQTARSQIAATLGPVAGPAYLRTAEAWLGMVERGAAVTFDGGMRTTISPTGQRVWTMGDSPSPPRVSSVPTIPPAR